MGNWSNARQIVRFVRESESISGCRPLLPPCHQAIDERVVDPKMELRTAIGLDIKERMPSIAG